MSKINPEGVFQEFLGVTVISSIHQKTLNFWKTIYSKLNQNELINQYYSLLPYQSYHMTTTNLYVKDYDALNNWNEYISDNLSFYQSLHFYLGKNQFTPTVTITSRIRTNGVLQLELSLPEEDVEKVYNFARIFGLEDKVPNTFHMTLAYQHKDIPLNKAELILEYLSNELFATQKTFRLRSPALHYFKDMTQFIEWDGRFNPFTHNEKIQLNEQERIAEVLHNFLSLSQRGFFKNQGKISDDVLCFHILSFLPLSPYDILDFLQLAISRSFNALLSNNDLWYKFYNLYFGHTGEVKEGISYKEQFIKESKALQNILYEDVDKIDDYHKNDLTFMRAAIYGNPLLIKVAPYALRDDDKITDHIFNEGYGSLYYCFSSRIKSQPDLIFAVLEDGNYDIEDFKNIEDALKSDSSFMLKAISYDVAMLNHASRELLLNKKFLIKAFEKKPKSFQYLSETFTQDNELLALLKKIEKKPNQLNFKLDFWRSEENERKPLENFMDLAQNEEFISQVQKNRHYEPNISEDLKAPASTVNELIESKHSSSPKLSANGWMAFIKPEYVNENNDPKKRKRSSQILEHPQDEKRPRFS